MMSVWSLKLGSSKLRRSSVAELVLVTYTCFSGTWREPYFLLDYFVSAQAYGAFFRIISDCSSQYCYPADVGEKVHRVNQIRWRDFNSSSSAPSTPPLPLFIAPFFFFFFFLRHCRFFPWLLGSILWIQFPYQALPDSFSASYTQSTSLSRATLFR